jgi:hypothetical protein
MNTPVAWLGFRSTAVVGEMILPGIWCVISEVRDHVDDSRRSTVVGVVGGISHFGVDGQQEQNKAPRQRPPVSVMVSQPTPGKHCGQNLGPHALCGSGHRLRLRWPVCIPHLRARDGGLRMVWQVGCGGRGVVCPGDQRVGAVGFKLISESAVGRGEL